MTATTAPKAPARKRVSWKDLMLVTLRQHRLMIISAGAVVVLAAIVMTALGLYVSANGTDRASLLGLSVSGAGKTVVAALIVFPGLIAVFWAAPLLSREYEHQTHLFVWSQDVSAIRWLTGKVAVLLGIAVALALLLGTTANLMMHNYNSIPADRKAFNLFSEQYFEAVPLVQVGYALFGFALGLVLSAITRRTVLSMGLTAGIFVVVRMGIAAGWRPYFQTPVRELHPVGGSDTGFKFGEGLYVHGGLLDVHGNEVDYPLTCIERASGSNGFDDCLRQEGVVNHFTDFQPADRLGSFQLVEFGIFTALALVLFAVAWRVLRKVGRL